MFFNLCVIFNIVGVVGIFFEESFWIFFLFGFCVDFKLILIICFSWIVNGKNVLNMVMCLNIFCFIVLFFLYISLRIFFFLIIVFLGFCLRV